MAEFAHAMHEIEWCDSGDSSSPKDTNAIKKALGGDKEKFVASVLIERAEKLTKQLQESTKRLKGAR
jgi:hypothetical protein